MRIIDRLGEDLTGSERLFLAGGHVFEGQLAQ
jgi:hypothetical protein